MRKRKSGDTSSACDADREPLVERLLLLLRFLRQADVLVDLARRHRPPERALHQAGHDPPGAGRLVLAVQVAADVDPRPALGRGRRRLRVRPADLDVADAHAVERNLLELHGCGIELFLRTAIRSGVALGGGMNTSAGPAG